MTIREHNESAETYSVMARRDTIVGITGVTIGLIGGLLAWNGFEGGITVPVGALIGTSSLIFFHAGKLNRARAKEQETIVIMHAAES